MTDDLRVPGRHAGPDARSDSRLPFLRLPGDSAPDAPLNLGHLRALAIFGPIAFVVGLELLGIFALKPATGSNELLWIAIVCAVLVAAVVPFSFWVFGIIQRQQEQLVDRIAQLHEANDRVARHNRQLDAANTAITSISSAIDLSRVLQNIVDSARTLIQSCYAALSVTDDEGQIVAFITAGISAEERAAIGPLPVGHGLLGTLIRDARPLRIADIAADPRSHGFPPNHPPMTTLLGVPILYQGKAVGDLYLTDKIGAAEFSDEDQELLVLLANHAAVAIENARLYEDARAARDRLQNWNDRLEVIVAERTRQIERYNREMTTRVLRAQEEERKRIARELHDDTAQSLSSMLISMDLLEPHLEGTDAAVHAGFDRVRTLTKRTLDEVRTLSHDLRPTILDDFGLSAALRWFADEYEVTFGVPVDVEVAPLPDERLNPETELALFRIAQEALTNSGKYAGATKTCVSLDFTDAAARLVVADNGRGFSPEEVMGPTRQGGLGLYGMRERAELLDGTLHVESVPGEGTRVTATVPIDDTEGTDAASNVTREGDD